MRLYEIAARTGLDKIKFLLKGPPCVPIVSAGIGTSLKRTNPLAGPATSGHDVMIFKLLRFSPRVNIGLDSVVNLRPIIELVTYLF